MTACAREAHYKHKTFGMVASTVKCLYPSPWMSFTILRLAVLFNLCTTVWKYIHQPATSNCRLDDLQYLTVVMNTAALGHNYYTELLNFVQRACW